MLVGLKSKSKKWVYKRNLGRQGVYYDAKDLFEPITDAEKNNWKITLKV